MAGKVCRTNGCPTILTDGNTRCPQHQSAHDKRRGTTTQRGYGAQHKALRNHYAHILTTTALPCARCGEPIQPGEPFDLGHTDDRNDYLGPEHATCNRRAGGKSAHR